VNDFAPSVCHHDRWGSKSSHRFRRYHEGRFANEEFASVRLECLYIRPSLAAIGIDKHQHQVPMLPQFRIANSTAVNRVDVEMRDWLSDRHGNHLRSDFARWSRAGKINPKQ
jgi:hypothetical protein